LEIDLQFLFADHVLDVDRRELRCGSTLIAVEPQVFDLLNYLLENRDRVVSKDDLIASVWRGRIVSDSTLDSRINAARRALGDNGDKQRLIRTIARRGFRFVSAVRLESESDASHGSPPGELQAPARAALPRSDGPAMKQIAEELGVGYLVEGSVRRSGDRVRITAQLNDAATGSQLWAERYDRCLSDVFAVQDEITEAIVAAIEPRVYAAENFRAERKAPESLDAWDLLMQALSHYWKVTREDNIAAQALLAKAIAIDPNYSHALAVLGVSHIFGAHMGWEPRATAVPAAECAGLAALRADSEDPWAHLAVAGVHVHQGRLEDALAEFEAALRLNSNFSLALGYYGLVLSYVGRWQEGAEAARRALRLSPRDPFSAICSGVAAYAEFVGRNYHEAIRPARQGVRQRFDFVGAHRVLTAAAAMAGEIDLAKSALQDLRRAQPNISLAWIASQMPLNDQEREHYLEALRRAGLD